nr:hypothetical protein [Tanacetum cinerariifolium]
LVPSCFAIFDLEPLSLSFDFVITSEIFKSLSFSLDHRCRLQEEKQLKEAQAVKAQSWKFPICYDDDDDEEGYNSLNDNIISELPSYSAVTPTEPVDSLIMEDEHLQEAKAQNWKLPI